jgi:hypothetical protein
MSVHRPFSAMRPALAGLDPALMASLAATSSYAWAYYGMLT